MRIPIRAALRWDGLVRQAPEPSRLNSRCGGAVPGRAQSRGSGVSVPETRLRTRARQSAACRAAIFCCRVPITSALLDLPTLIPPTRRSIYVLR